MAESTEFDKELERACSQLNAVWQVGIAEVRKFVHEATMKLASEFSSDVLRNDDAPDADAEPKSAAYKLHDTLRMRFNRQVEVPAADRIREILRKAWQGAENELVRHYAGAIHHRAIGVFHRGLIFERTVEEGGDVTAFVDDLNAKFPDGIEKDGLKIGFVGIGSSLRRLENRWEFSTPEGVKTRVQIANVEADALGHRSMFDEVVKELVNNAFRHMPDGGTLSVNMRVEGEEVVVEFSDTGRGINDEDLPRVFDKGFTKSEGGTGWGLYFVKLYMEKFMKGSVDVESTEGQGATFRLRMPLAKINEVQRKS